VKAWFEGQGRGPVEIHAGRAGQFDIMVDGRLAYSRYDTGRFPSAADLAALGAGGAGQT
jgi:predicted Rdx family selenoprotein